MPTKCRHDWPTPRLDTAAIECAACGLRLALTGYTHAGRIVQAVSAYRARHGPSPRCALTVRCVRLRGAWSSDTRRPPPPRRRGPLYGGFARAGVGS